MMACDCRLLEQFDCETCERKRARRVRWNHIADVCATIERKPKLAKIQRVVDVMTAQRLAAWSPGMAPPETLVGWGET